MPASLLLWTLWSTVCVLHPSAFCGTFHITVEIEPVAVPAYMPISLAWAKPMPVKFGRATSISNKIFKNIGLASKPIGTPLSRTWNKPIY